MTLQNRIKQLERSVKSNTPGQDDIYIELGCITMKVVRASHSSTTMHVIPAEYKVSHVELEKFLENNQEWEHSRKSLEETLDKYNGWKD